MNKTRLLAAACAIVVTMAATAQTRTNIKLNRGWKFIREAVAGAEQPGFDDSKWRTVNLPHDAQVEGTFQQKGDGATARDGYLKLGKGVYRKSFTIHDGILAADGRDIPLTLGGGRGTCSVFLDFEGVFRDARLYVNGSQVGGLHRNGFLGFSADITSLLREGGNVVAVTYDNTYSRSSRWYNGEGINRDVWLRVVSPLHVKRLSPNPTPKDPTPTLSCREGERRWLVDIETEVENSGTDSVLCQIVTDIVDADGKTVSSRKAVAPFAAGETFTFHQQLPVDNPHLWNVGAPYLYKAVSRVYSLPYNSAATTSCGSAGTLTDDYSKTFGLRTITMSPDSGLAVNGRRVYVNGVCLHTDLGPLGTASFTDAWDKRLSVIKDSLGCNAIRLSHNVYPEYVLEWADRHGVLVFDEFFDKWRDDYYGKGSGIFDNNLSKDIRSDFVSWINRDKHHPSVFIWGVGNEVYEQIEWKRTERYGVKWLKDMVALAHATDPTRPATVGQYPNRFNGVRKADPQLFAVSEPHPFEFYTDVATTNYLENFWNRDHAKYPQLIFLESEMAVGDLGYDFFNFDHSYPVGQFYWGGTDYIGESFGWPAKGWVRGLIDFTNRLKPLGQSVRSFYTAKPMTHIVTRPQQGQGSLVWNDLKMTWIPLEEHWNYKVGDTLTVQVMSNCDETELLLNGRSLGRKPLPPKDKAPELTWQLPWQPGTLRAVGYNDGVKVAEETLRTAGPPARIIARIDSTVLSPNGEDLAYIDYTVVDHDGNVCPEPVKLQFTIKGPVTMAGVANGNMLSDEPWQGANFRTTSEGRCQLILRSGYTAGKAVVTAKGKGVKSATVHLTVE